MVSSDTMKREQVAAAVHAIPSGGDYVWDGVSEDDKPLSADELKTGLALRGHPVATTKPDCMDALKALLEEQHVTSLELVDLLNSLRTDGEPRLRHDHFMRKAKRVVGNCETFRVPHTYPKNGQTHSVFNFPRREACLIVLAHGCRVQAMMFDLLDSRRCHTRNLGSVNK